MQRLYYQFPGTWFGDCMPFGKGDTFYLFHQRDRDWYLIDNTILFSELPQGRRPKGQHHQPKTKRRLRLRPGLLR